MNENKVTFKYDVEFNDCIAQGQCHPETCNHYRFYLTRDGKRMMGSDDIDDIRDMINDLRNVHEGELDERKY